MLGPITLILIFLPIFFLMAIVTLLPRFKEEAARMHEEIKKQHEQSLITPPRDDNGNFPILAPALGRCDSAIITSWLKKDGDNILKGTPVCEIETDKVAMDVLAPANGVLRTHTIPNTAFAQGERLGHIDPTSH